MSDDTRDTAELGKKRNTFVDFFVRLVKEKPLGTVGGLIVLLLFFTGVFADLAWFGLPNIGLAPHGYNEFNLKAVSDPPSFQYWLGTDGLGRDLLSRIIYGARISMLVGVIASIGSTVLATLIGVVSGYLGGKFDLVLQRFIDAWMSFPSIIILLTVMSVVGPGLWQIIAVLSVMFAIGGSRVVRSMVISIKENIYVEAAVATGCSTMRILFKHILPNIMPIVIVGFSGRMAGIILTEASLSFFGMGIPPPQPSWGGMLSGGRGNMMRAPWAAIWPGLALSISIYGINMFGDAARDLIDPRMRGGLGSFGKAAKKKMKEIQD